MKLIKKIAAIMFAFMMVVSMSCNVKADEGTTATTEKGKITINNAIPGQTYKIYKILELESYDSTTGNYAYKVTPEWKSFVENEGQTYLTKVDGTDYVNWVGDSADNGEHVKAFAEKAMAYVRKENSPVNTYTKENAPEASAGQATTSVTFNNLPLGYYLVDSSVGTLCSLDTTKPNVDINEKNGVPSVTKTFVDRTNTNNASIGDVITFNTVVDVKKGAQSYVLHDKMSAGLKLNQKLNADNDKPVLITKDNHETLIYGTDFTFTETTDGFTIDFSKAFLKRFEDKDYTLLVMYSATLTDVAVIGGAGNTNETYLNYGVDSESNHSTTTTKTFEMNVFKFYNDKKSNTDKGLAGATFKLTKDSKDAENITFVKTSNESTTEDVYRVAKTGETVTTITSPKSGKFTIQGLGAGTYYLTETKQPAGYNKLSAPVTVVIDAKGNVTVGGTAANPVKVENKSGTVLPSTGGAGTTMIYLVGAVLVLGSGVVLATKRRVKGK